MNEKTTPAGELTYGQIEHHWLADCEMRNGNPGWLEFARAVIAADRALQRASPAVVEAIAETSRPFTGKFHGETDRDRDERISKFYEDELSEAGSHKPQQIAEPAVGDEVECEICLGRGTIDETLGGEHFSNPEAECPNCDGCGYWNTTTGDVAMPVIAYLRATPEGQPVWAEDCVCEDAIWPMACDDNGDVSMPLVRLADAQAEIAALTADLQVKISECDVYQQGYDLRQTALTEKFVEIATLTAERDALRQDAARWHVWRDSLSEQSQDYDKEPELFRLLQDLPDTTVGPRTPAQIESDTDSAIAAITEKTK